MSHPDSNHDPENVREEDSPWSKKKEEIAKKMPSPNNWKRITRNKKKGYKFS